MKLKLETKFARAFSAIAAGEKALESTAASILSIIKAEKITDVKVFDTAVSAAYEANGWHTKPGRPTITASGNSNVPSTVRTYVSWVRAAFKAGLRMSRFETFQDLRKALAKKTGKKSATGGRAAANGVKIPDAIAESFRGVKITEDQPNGGLFHDLALVYLKLDENERGLYGRQLNQLLGQYRAHAFPAKEKTRRAA